jgi:hypothetical protein
MVTVVREDYPSAQRSVVQAPRLNFHSPGEALAVFSYVVKEAGEPCLVRRTKSRRVGGGPVRHSAQMLARRLPVFSAGRAVREVHRPDPGSPPGTMTISDPSQSFTEKISLRSERPRDSRGSGRVFAEANRSTLSTIQKMHNSPPPVTRASERGRPAGCLRGMEFHRDPESSALIWCETRSSPCEAAPTSLRRGTREAPSPLRF